MKVLVEFLKTALIGGLLVLLPLLLFYFLFGEILDAFIALATPIADLFPKDTFPLHAPDILAGLLILGASFLLGLAIKLQWVANLGSWLEAHTLAYLPFYRAIKRLGRGLIGASGSDTFRGGVLTSENGTQELIYIIEELDDGRMVVLIPFAPASFTGSAKIVAGDEVTLLDVSAGEVSKVIAHWGVGTAEALGLQTKD